MSSRGARTLPETVSRVLEAIDLSSAARRQTPCLVLTVGLPGSGKSTFSRRLAAELGAAVLESDALRRRLFAVPTHSPEESRFLFAAIHEAARILLSRGFSVIIDATSLKESDRRPVYALAAETGSFLQVLHFSAPEAVIRRRLRRREEGATVDTSTAGYEVYQRMAATMEPPLRVDWRIDTSDEPATESALKGVVEACRQAAGSPTWSGGEGIEQTTQ